MITVILTHAKIYMWPGAIAIINFVNPWHVNTYAFMSGVVARKPPSEKAFKGLVNGIILPNLLFCLIVFPALCFSGRGRGEGGFGALSATRVRPCMGLAMGMAQAREAGRGAPKCIPDVFGFCYLQVYYSRISL